MKFSKEKTIRDEAYLDFIRSCPCIICMLLAPSLPHTGPSEPHHHNKDGHGGKGIKCPDIRAIPLCFDHHREIHQHGKHTFIKEHNVDLEYVIETLNRIWEEKNGRRDQAVHPGRE